jgi:hypothetical protein
MQIVNWKSHLKFPEEAGLSPDAKDLISRLLCNVNHRLGSKGADEIKVLYGVFFFKLLDLLYYILYLYIEFTFVLHSSSGSSVLQWC